MRKCPTNIKNVNENIMKLPINTKQVNKYIAKYLTKIEHMNKGVMVPLTYSDITRGTSDYLTRKRYTIP